MNNNFIINFTFKYFAYIFLIGVVGILISFIWVESLTNFLNQLIKNCNVILIAISNRIITPDSCI